MKSYAFNIFKLLAYLLAVVVGSALLTVCIHSASHKVVAKWAQPKVLEGDTFGPHCLCVLEEDLDWSHFPYTVERNYVIYVGRDTEVPTHGHLIKYSFQPDDSNEIAHIKKSQVEWAKEGVTFCEASGHRLFIPIQMYKGGR